MASSGPLGRGTTNKHIFNLGLISCMTISSIHRWFCFALEPQTMAVNMYIYIIICTCFFFVLAQAVVTSIFIRFMCCFVQVTSSGLCPHDNVGSWRSIHVLLYVSILLCGHIHVPPDTLICHKTKQKPWKYGYVEVLSQYTCTVGVLSQYTCTLFMLLLCSRPIHMHIIHVSALFLPSSCTWHMVSGLF